MADSSEENRTHEATPRKVAQARSEGLVAVSHDLMSGFVVFAACAALIACGRAAVGVLVLFFRESIRASAGPLSVGAALAAGLRATASVLAIPMVAIVGAALAVGYLQTRGLVRTNLLLPNAQRIGPRLLRLWGTDKLAATGQALAKVVALLAVAGACIYSAAAAIARSSVCDVSRVLDGIFVIAKHLGLGLAFTLLGLGLADYLWKRCRHRKTLRMTHDEAKREHRETEGDPAFKAERRRIHLELSQAKALAELAQADLVVIEPGCAAIALRYDPAFSGAPVIVCKGRNHFARRIEAAASQVGVPVIVSASLAEELARSDEGEQIPERLYEPVAELLANGQLGLAGTSRRGQSL